MRVIDIFNRAAGQFPSRPCLIDDARSWSYAEVQLAAWRLAWWLSDEVEGLSPRIAVLSHNCAEAMVAILAVFQRNGVWIPANSKAPGDHIGSFLRTSRCQLLLAHRSLETVATQAARLANCRLQLLPDIASLGAPAEEPAVHPWQMDDHATLFATGGTTGSPKAALWTHRTWATQFANFHAGISHRGIPVNLAATPISHAAGLVSIYMFALGASTVLIERAEPTRVMDALETYRVTTVFLPPTVIYALLAHLDVRNRDFSSLQNMIYAAAPMSVDKLKAAIEIFGPVMSQTFGQAEAPMVCTILTRDDHVEALQHGDDSRLASCGKPALLTQVAIVDNAGNEVPSGIVGEVVVKGDLVMAGYFENEEATAACRLENGWQRTGDLGAMDGQGFLSITDRKRDMIISGGFNVYPSEIEHVLWSHEAIQDCAVIGCPDPKWGEAVVAVVELKAGKSCDAQTLIALCKERLGSVRTPKRIDFWSELPRSPVGKVLKRAIRDHYWASETRKI
jgi:acyl-CoA synthetase (AMP-forming)/AMP-acid ligase II